MREILFKAKRLDNGEWAYGDLMQHEESGRCIIGGIFAIGKYGYIDTDYHEVDPETVCQFTGLTDSDGKKVFEGDVLNFGVDNERTKWSGYIEFGNPNGNYSWGWQIVRMSGDRLNTDTLLWFDMENIGVRNKVIGNIHDKEEPNNEN